MEEKGLKKLSVGKDTSLRYGNSLRQYQVSSFRRRAPCTLNLGRIENQLDAIESGSASAAKAVVCVLFFPPC